jgi:hypothetical protein
MLSPKDQIVTVITRHGAKKSQLVQDMEAAGAEVWTNLMIRASYEGLKKALPNNPWKDMRSLYGKKRGETLFICGSGPSLADCPEKLPGTTFAINRAIHKIKADYFCFCDVKATRDAAGQPNLKTAEWAFGSAMHVFFKNQPGYLIEANGTPSSYLDEKVRPLYWNGATFSWVLSWAVKMKPKRIVFVGCDYTLGGYYDGTPIGASTQLGAQVISEIARLRVDDMFGPDKAEWFDPDVELIDTSLDGYLPVKKMKLEDVL